MKKNSGELIAEALDAQKHQIIELLEARILTSPQPDMKTDMLGSFSHAMHNQMIRNMVALIKREITND